MLPRQVDPRKLVSQGATLSGEIPPQQMGRLAAAVAHIGSSVMAELTFSRDEQGVQSVSGRVETRVSMQCQRCLTPVTIELVAKPLLGIVWTEQEVAQLPRRYDPWLVGETGELHAMVEDELLLELPIVAFHKENECPGSGSFSSGEPEVVQENPFKILEQLKTDK